jgi:hypothetical protein
MFFPHANPENAAVRSLLQKAVRRGYTRVVEGALNHLYREGDRTGIRSRTIVITFEECWPLASALAIDKSISSKMDILAKVARSFKQKDASGLGALAWAYHEGDRSMVDLVPDPKLLPVISDALQDPARFFEQLRLQSPKAVGNSVVNAAQKYLPSVSWGWDKACLLSAGLFSSISGIPPVRSASTPRGLFPFWVALDKHTPQGKEAIRGIARKLGISAIQLRWVSFYSESTCVNEITPSPWYDAEKKWKLLNQGLSIEDVENIWRNARDLVRNELREEANSLHKKL